MLHLSKKISSAWHVIHQIIGGNYICMPVISANVRCINIDLKLTNSRIKKQRQLHHFGSECISISIWMHCLNLLHKLTI